MNILVVAPHGLYGNYTGSFVHNQAKAYVALGHRVRVVIPLAVAKRSNEGQCFSWPVTMHMQDGVEICYVRHLSLSGLGAKIFNGKSAAFAVRLLTGSILRDFQPDIIHAHTIHFGGTVAKAFLNRRKVPMVITTHGGDTDLALEPKMQAFARAICNCADAVVAISSVYLEKLRQLGVKTHTQRILNGFAVENIQPAEKVRHRVVQAGNLIPLKYYNHTIRALARIKSNYPDLTFIIVGEGPERPRLEALCQELGIAECVQFAGQLPNPDTLAEMAKAEIFVMPSSPEGFGIVYLEAMASGCITIGTRGEGIADVITHGENGYLVEPKSVDSIVETVTYCFEHRQESTQAATKGRQDALQLTWEKNAETYVELFRKLTREADK